MLIFWAEWCVPCMAQLAHYQAMVAGREDQVTVIGVNIDEQPSANDALAVARASGVQFPIVVDRNGDIARDYNPRHEMPFAVFIDAERRIVQASRGYTQARDANTDLAIDMLVSGRRPVGGF